tara:strand:- start:169 stop:474 length:306 start_codon:yes stop_codon:yes gene_type:complete
VQTNILIQILQVEVKDIIKRFEISNGGDRPLLKTEDPEQTLAEIYDKRKSLYEQADVVIDVKQSMNTKGERASERKWLQPPTSTTKPSLTHSIRLARSAQK